MMRLQIEFMALIFIVVYVGAIAVLFLFVVMMLNLNTRQASEASSELNAERDSQSPLQSFRNTSLRVVFITGMRRSPRRSSEVVWKLPYDSVHEDRRGESYVSWVNRLDPRTSLETLGQVLYTSKLAYLVMAGFVLLVARVGAIVLTLQVRSFALAKRQQVHQQRSRDLNRALMFTRIS